jgi:hypothetical protein
MNKSGILVGRLAWAMKASALGRDDPEALI